MTILQDELAEAQSQEKFVPKGRNDILTMTLGNLSIQVEYEVKALE